RHPHIVLEDFYTLLVRAYLHGGHIYDAMMVILRAKKQLGMDRLPALARLDAKTAHLVRAGLAAGKLLDGGGLATLFVKSNSETPAGAATPPNQAKNRLSDPRRNHSAETPGSPVVRQGATAGQGATQRPPLKTGQIIMFPTRPKNTTLPMDPEVPKS
ncbi:MAG: hypothetical protein NTV34_00315, partial [Proteobacteria bacterium]|nr:hypothetical protein [Pseudomonadota bacterium]